MNILNRQQLSQFLPNHEAIKAFEQLFNSVADVLPNATDDAQFAADNAAIQAGQALASLAVIAEQLSLILLQPLKEQQTSDLYTQSVQESLFPELYIPPVSFGTMADQNANKVNISGGSISNVSFSGTNIVAPETHAATSKATPVDADELPISDSAASFGLKKLTWSNLKATLSTWINSNLIPAYFTVIGARTDVNAMQYATLENRLHQAALTQGVGLKLQLGDISEPNKWGSIEIVPVSAFESSGDVIIKAYNGSLFSGLPAEIIRLSAANGVTVLGGATMLNTATTLTNGAGAAAGTLLNAPVAGNPTKWIAINDNGTTRKIPAW